MEFVDKAISLFRDRHENAAVRLFSPFRRKRGRATLLTILTLPGLLFALFPPLGIIMTVVVLWLLPVFACIMIFARKRSKELVEDLWLSGMTPSEVVFGLCYWPTRIVLTATAIAFGFLLFMIILTRFPPGWQWVLGVVLAVPFPILLAMLAGSLDMSGGAFEWLRHSANHLTRSLAGATMVYLGCSWLLHQALPATAIRNRSPEILSALAAAIVSFAMGAYVFALEARLRIFAGIPVINIAQHIPDYKDTEPEVSFRVSSPPFLLSVGVAVVMMLGMMETLAGVALLRWRGYGAGINNLSLFVACALRIETILVAALGAVVLSVPLLSRFVPDARFSINRRKLMPSQIRHAVPILLGIALVILATQPLGVAAASLEGLRRSDSALRLYLWASAILAVPSLCLSLFPRDGRASRVVITLLLISGMGVAQAVCIPPAVIAELLPRSPEMKMYRTLADGALFIAISLYLAWVCYYGEPFLKKRLIREAVEQETAQF